MEIALPIVFGLLFFGGIIALTVFLAVKTSKEQEHANCESGMAGQRRESPFYSFRHRAIALQA